MGEAINWLCICSTEILASLIFQSYNDEEKHNVIGGFELFYSTTLLSVHKLKFCNTTCTTTNHSYITVCRFHLKDSKYCFVFYSLLRRKRQHYKLGHTWFLYRCSTKKSQTFLQCCSTKFQTTYCVSTVSSDSRRATCCLSECQVLERPRSVALLLG